MTRSTNPTPLVVIPEGNPRSSFALAVAVAFAFAFLVVIPAGNLLLAFAFAFLVVIPRTGNLLFAVVIPEGARLQPCRTHLATPAALAAEVSLAHPRRATP